MEKRKKKKGKKERKQERKAEKKVLLLEYFVMLIIHILTIFKNKGIV